MGSNIKSIPGNSEMPLTKFQKNQQMVKGWYEKQTEVQKTHNVQTVTHPETKKKWPAVAAIVPQAKVEQAGQNPDAREVKENVKKSNHFLNSLLALIKGAISRFLSNFSKKGTTDANIPIAPKAPPLPGEIRIALATTVSPEALTPPETSSHAFNQMMSFIIEERLAGMVMQEGIFRVSGSKSHVDKIVKQLTDSPNVELRKVFSEEELTKPTSPEYLSGDDFATALKEIVGQMNIFGSPDMTHQILTAAESLGDTEVPEADKIMTLRIISQKLPPNVKKDLAFLMELLCLVADNKWANKMGASNLALIFGPRLIKEVKIGDLNKLKIAIENLINYQNKIF